MFIKPQDLVFLAALVILLFKRDGRLFALAGLACLALSIPLFAKWVFFTAQHLIYYAFVFFAVSIILHALSLRKRE